MEIELRGLGPDDRALAFLHATVSARRGRRRLFPQCRLLPDTLGAGPDIRRRRCAGIRHARRKRRRTSDGWPPDEKAVIAADLQADIRREQVAAAPWPEILRLPAFFALAIA